jgi:hypothetical protein
MRFEHEPPAVHSLHELDDVALEGLPSSYYARPLLAVNGGSDQVVLKD